MALSRTETLLSLDEWASILGISQWEFNGCSAGLPQIAIRGCESVFFQHSWQHDFLSREEIAHAINNAENQVAQLLGYYPSPKAIVNEQAQYPKSKRGAYNQSPITTPRFDNVPVKVKWQKICSTGVYSETVLDATAAITYSTTNDVEDTFTVSVATTETNPDNILVFVPTASRFGDTTRSQRWQIRPVTVTISGGTATIRGHKAQCVIPSLLEAYEQANLDATNAANFLTTLEIVQRTIDTTTPITALWNPDRINGSSASANLNDACWAGGYEHTRGYIRPNFTNCSTANGRGGPDSVIVDYVAGLPMVNGRMEFHMAQIVTYLSIALLSSEACGCERSNRIIRHWRKFPSDGDPDSRGLTQDEINANPFKNARTGARYAWGEILQLTEKGTNV
jgi:hypothetical protein